MMELTKLPNIENTLAEKLFKAGISTIKDLIKLGAEQAFLRLSIEDETSCFNMLCALEGAIQGIRWHGISKERMNELKEFLRLKRIK
ncbi:MAG: TfoX/Sxy family DNA transformation protein [Mariniphaga sp.]|nr:TfoX/Sxy family DNA transformation protein [Mariniphaga sp.]